MKLEYLQRLKIHNQMDGFTDEGISEVEIKLLEQLYNQGNPFPGVLNELLLLAGKYCHFLDYSIYDSPQEMQDGEREELKDDGIIISRCHFFVCLASHGLPCFIFLDEGNNPELNQLLNYPSQENYFRRTGGTLQDLINSRIQNYLDGYNPF